MINTNTVQMTNLDPGHLEKFSEDKQLQQNKLLQLKLLINQSLRNLDKE